MSCPPCHRNYIGFYMQPTVRQKHRDYLQNVTTKKLQKNPLNDFTFIQCSTTKISTHINGLLLVMLQQKMYEKQTEGHEKTSAFDNLGMRLV